MQKLIFAASDGSIGFEYYLTDGVTTTLIGDLNPGPGDSYIFNDDFAQIGGTFVFAATNGQAGSELFESDGTQAGTTLLKDINFGTNGSFPIILEAVAGKTYFAAITAAEGDELWVTDGTPGGTVLLRDINPGAPSSSPNSFEAFKTSLIFVADNGVNGRELFVSDGTALGTRVVRDINAGAASSNPGALSEDGANILGNKFFFSAESGTIGRELWVSDGTEAGTVLVRDIRGEPTDIVGNVGTAATTAPGTSVRSTIDPSGDTDVFAIELVGGTTYKFNLRGTGAGETLADPLLRVLDSGGNQLAVNDDGPGGGPLDSEITFVAPSTGTFFLSAESFSGAVVKTGTYLLSAKIDGGPLAVNLEDFNSNSSNPDNFQSFKGSMFFTANDGVNGTELWVTDGTNGGTQLVKDINPNVSSNPLDLTVLGDHLIFSANNGTTGQELWVSDGTPQGTTLLKDLNGGSSGSDPFGFIQLGNKLIFAASDNTTGRELYVTDGTVGGTGLLLDISSGAGSSNPSDFTLVGDTIFFNATNTANGTELWKTDGTAAGTTRVTDLDPGADSSSPDLIGVLVLNSAPTSLDLSNSTISENSPVSTVVGTLSATDADGDALSFSLTSNPGGLFAINGNSLQVAGALDFESATSHQITAEVSDGQGGTSSHVFNITVTDVNEGGGSVGQVVNGGPGNDTLDSTAGNDTINGAAGIDTVIYAVNKNQLTEHILPNGNVSVELPGGETDLLNSVERVQFNDGVYRFDLGVEAPAVYRLYAAAYARTPDEAGQVFWTEQARNGLTQKELAGFFIRADESIERYGENPTDLQFINALYQNVLDRDADAGGRDFWLGVFQNDPEGGKEDLLIYFADSTENINNNAANYDVGVFLGF